MSILPNQTFLNPTFQFYAGGYTATGGMSSNNNFPAGTSIAPGFTSNIFTFNSNLMPEIGKSYQVNVSGEIGSMTRAGCNAGAYANIGLQYDSGVVNNSVSGSPIISASNGPVCFFNITDIFERKATPTVPLRLILGNNTGGTITAGTVRVTALNVMEVPNPVNLADSNIRS
jgi:hypothetical protein